jgi:hypothetical protein
MLSAECQFENDLVQFTVPNLIGDDMETWNREELYARDLGRTSNKG